MKINNYTGVVFSAHLASKKENIGDVLSAKAIAILLGKKCVRKYCLPDDAGLSKNQSVVYGGGGMLRPLFSQKEYRDFVFRNKATQYAIYGIGINLDFNGPNFSQADLAAMNRWITGASTVTVRDKTSLNFVRKNFHCQAKLAPCPTYNILKKINKQSLGKRYKIGVVPSFGHTEAYQRQSGQVVTFITNLIKKIGQENICFICHDEQDYETAKQLFFGLKISVIKPLSFGGVYSAYSACESIITLRGHGIIFAAAVGCPCSYIPLNIKLNSLYGYHYGGSYRQINFDCNYHLRQLRKNRYPLDLNINFII